jgi:hypothetical protein
MAEKPEDLWPAAIANETEIEVPATIAAEQARLLGQKAKNVIVAKVMSIPCVELGKDVVCIHVVRAKSE